MKKSEFLKVGSTYIAKEYEPDRDQYLPTGSLYRYNGVVRNPYGWEQHQFQCVEIDCEDDFRHYSTGVKGSQFQEWYQFNS